MKRTMKAGKCVVSICLACVLMSSPLAVSAESTATESEAESTAVKTEAESTPAETEAELELEGQLTLEDLSALGNGAESVFSHNGQVTLVDGTCTSGPVKNAEDAAAVVDSMMTLIGADANTQFIPWREVQDPLGHTYYIFQQMYHDTTVCGGAVKVITDSEGNMIGLTSSVESEMPDVSTEEGITAEEAEKIVQDKEYETDGRSVRVLSQFTDQVILPSVLKFDIENEDVSNRFAWVVYTDNPSGNANPGVDLPYLAHYVSMSGEYLYSIPAITPDDEAGRSGYDTSYVFEFMEPVDYTGYVDLSTGEEKEITVTLMRDKRTGMYFLGNIERRILVGNCYDFLYNDGQVVLESSPDNLEWDQIGLLSLYNYCRAYDYYKEIGWIGGDGLQTPIMVLNNFCDDHFNATNNACYIGNFFGMQCFAASNENDLSQCLDVIAHEFTHCVTGSVMTYNSYVNDYGAINEALSDIQGKACEMMAGDTEPTDWVMGSHGLTPVRSMSDPHRYMQPEYSWDIYYMANVENPSPSNDHGGVHFNSSLLNQIAYILQTEGNMSLDDTRTFWFMADCAMVPKTDYMQLAELLPFILKIAGMDQYEEVLTKAIESTRLGDNAMPETMDEEHAMLKLSLPDTEAFDAGNWAMVLTTVDVGNVTDRVSQIVGQVMNNDFSFIPGPIRDFFDETEKEAEAMKEKEASENPLDVLGDIVKEILSDSPFEEKSEEELQKEMEEKAAKEAETEKFVREVMDWLSTEMNGLVFTSMGFAGQDGSTLQMVVLPGRCIPLLLHATYTESSDEPDQIAMAVYLNGKWHELNLDPIMSESDEFDALALGKEIRDALIGLIMDVIGENGSNLLGIRSIEDVLDLISVNIEGGEFVELSSEGLEEIVIPEPTPAEEKPYGTLVPGKKSRPKLDAISDEESADQAESEEAQLDEAA